MFVITNLPVRLFAILFVGVLLPACVPPPPLPPPPGDWNEYGPAPVQPGPAGQTSNTDSPNSPDHGTPPAPQGPQEYPVAKPTGNPDQVISPYPPNNVIDVSGFHSGQLARDPSNRKIFRIP